MNVRIVHGVVLVVSLLLSVWNALVDSTSTKENVRMYVLLALISLGHKINV